MAAVYNPRHKLSVNFTMTSLKLKAPEVLPSEGVTSVAFKAWKNSLLSFLEQDTTNYLFLSGGMYASWIALSDSPNRKRISTLNDRDPETLKLQRKIGDLYTNEDLQSDQAELLLKRNSQISKLIQLIAVCCYYSEHDDITNLSTSTDWIFNYLLQHYNLEKKGAHFLKVSDLKYKEGSNHQTFYREFRSAICDNTKPRGHRIQYLNNKELVEDEGISPTFEETIVLWCLEKIDSRLPMHVNKTFGHQMVGNTTLKDLQVQIFQRIPSMLQDLNDTEVNRASALNATTAPNLDEPSLAAYRATSNQRFRPRQRRNLFCNICKTAGRPPAVFESHQPSRCKLKSALVNSILVDEDDDNEEFEQDNYGQPFTSHGSAQS